MLTVVPPLPRDEEEDPLMDFVRHRRHYVGKALLVVVTVLHAWAAVTLLLAPDAQLFTQGTRPMFALASPAAWAVAFAVGAAAAGGVLLRPTAARLWALGMTAIPAQAVWLGAAVLAVWFDDSGSAMSVVFLSASFAFTVVAALYVAAEHAGRR